MSAHQERSIPPTSSVADFDRPIQEFMQEPQDFDRYTHVVLDEVWRGKPL